MHGERFSPKMTTPGQQSVVMYSHAVMFPDVDRSRLCRLSGAWLTSRRSSVKRRTGSCGSQRDGKHCDSKDRAKSPQLPGSSVLVHSIASEELFPPVMLDDLAGAGHARTRLCPFLASSGICLKDRGGGGCEHSMQPKCRTHLCEAQGFIALGLS